jgi:hypothetical protein
MQVTMTGGDEYAAQVIGVDADKDVAVLRLNMPDTVDREARACLIRKATPWSWAELLRMSPLPAAAGCLACLCSDCRLGPGAGAAAAHAAAPCCSRLPCLPVCTVYSSHFLFALQEKLHPMRMGTSSDLLVGQRVYAIGMRTLLIAYQRTERLACMRTSFLEGRRSLHVLVHASEVSCVPMRVLCRESFRP